MLEFAYKYIFDISCYYAIISYFLDYTVEYEVHSLTFMLLITTAFLNGFLDGKEKYSIGKIARLLIPLIALFWETETLGRVVAFIPWMYIVIRSFTEQYHTGYVRFKSMFGKTLALYFVPILILTGFADNVVGIRAIGATVPYLIIYISMGIMLLQLLRHQSGTADKKVFEKYQLRQSIAFFAFSFLITVGGLAKLIGGFIYDYIVSPLMMTILGLMSYTGYVVEAFTNDTKTQNKIQSYKYYVQSQSYDTTRENVEQILEMGENASSKPAEFVPMDVTMLAITFGIVIVLIVFFVLRGEKKQKIKPGILEDERETISDFAEPEAKLKKNSTSPRVVVRYYYCKFMKKAETEEKRIHKADTTDDIEKKYVLSRGSKELSNTKHIKEIYRKARYSNVIISKEDASKMKKLVKKA